MQETGLAQTPPRHYYLDQLRVFLILLIFLTHCALPFVAEDRWHIANAETTFAATASIGFCYQWGMQLFFLVCGAGTGLSLRHRTSRQFVLERFYRLLVPYITAILLLVPFQRYFEFLHKHRFQGSILSFYYDFYHNLSVGWRLNINYDTFHLWFLRYLFEYSIIALPLFLFFKMPKGREILARVLTKLAERPFWAFVLVLPIIVIQAALRVEAHKHEGWANYVSWFAFFVYGYLLVPDRRLEKTIVRTAKYAFPLGLACFALMGLVFYFGSGEQWELHPSYSAGFVAYQALTSLNTCCWVLFFLAMGMRFLDSCPVWLKGANAILLPFYILHHVVIIVFAYYVVQLNASILAKYLLISVPSFVVSCALCQFVVRPIPVLRLFLGMSGRLRPGGARYFAHPPANADGLSVPLQQK